MTKLARQVLNPARMLHPAWYHGHDKRPPFFEGWYFKLVEAGGQHRYAIIPGIFKSDDPAQHHAFVQVLDGTTGQATYHRFPVESFRAARDRFEVTIGANRFTEDYISLQLSGNGQTLYGEIHFEGLTPWPVTLLSPGIMGWYAWVPTMECYHGVLSLDHTLRGAWAVDGQAIDWNNGRGYIEKDWGVSFPSAWIWLQTNHFAPTTLVGSQGTSLTASVAIIPWRRTSFRGMIVGLWHGGRLYRFATYTGAKTERLEVAPDVSSGDASSGVECVTWVLRGRPFVGGPVHQLELRAQRASEGTRAEGGLIRGPSTVDMGVRVAESLSASVEARLTRLGGGQAATIFEGTGRYAGLEIMGDLERLLEA